jgi:hypothetical protein
VLTELQAPWGNNLLADLSVFPNLPGLPQLLPVWSQGCTAPWGRAQALPMASGLEKEKADLTHVKVAILSMKTKE